jgi:cyclophilin family peptidyl-prolyl cis-trans isomerase
VDCRPTDDHSQSATLENLESRTLLAAAPRVVDFSADNRGTAVITFDHRMDARSFHSNSVRIYTAGPDQKLGTGDDVVVKTKMSLDSKAYVLTVNGRVPLDAGYRVKLWGNKVKDASGAFLDGEFNGTAPSGNGTAGGDFDVRARRDTSEKPIAILTSKFGYVLIKLRGDLAPLTVKNFLSYANSAAYDNTVIHHNSKADVTAPAPPTEFLLEAGKYKKDGTTITKKAAIPFEGKLGNAEDTVAMTRDTSTDPDSATSIFFFNMKDNKDRNPGALVDGEPVIGNTVFAQVVQGHNVLNEIYHLATAAFPSGGGTGGGTGGGAGGQQGPVVTNDDATTTPVVFSRVAIKMKVLAV